MSLKMRSGETFLRVVPARLTRKEDKKEEKPEEIKKNVSKERLEGIMGEEFLGPYGGLDCAI